MGICAIGNGLRHRVADRRVCRLAPRRHKYAQTRRNAGWLRGTWLATFAMLVNQLWRPNLFLPLMWENTENPVTDKQTLNTYAWLLPHGIPLGCVGYMNHKTVVDISKIFLQFDTRNAEFIPGWRSNPYLEIEKPRIKEVMVATWAHPQKNKVLAVVSNLIVKDAQEIALTLKNPHNTTVKNVRTGEMIDCSGRKTSSCASAGIFYPAVN